MVSFFSPMDEPPFVSHRHVVPPVAIPGHSNQRALLYQSDSLGVAVHRFECFSVGFAFTVQVEGRGHGLGRFHFLFDPSDSWANHQQSGDTDPYDQPDQQFRLGLQFADGTTWENYVEHRRPGPDVVTIGASGTSTGCTVKLWVPMLPAPGDFSVHGLWPSVGMSECSVAFNGDEIIAAAEAEIPLLP